MLYAVHIIMSAWWKTFLFENIKSKHEWIQVTQYHTLFPLILVYVYLISGHPKVKAFITHGGSHGIYEGMSNGVPMVMLPLFGDQPDNVQRMVGRGVAVSLNFADVTSAKLLDALNKVIGDER